jgi:hypothetical protein
MESGNLPVFIGEMQPLNVSVLPVFSKSNEDQRSGRSNIEVTSVSA